MSTGGATVITPADTTAPLLTSAAPVAPVAPVVAAAPAPVPYGYPYAAPPPAQGDSSRPLIFTIIIIIIVIAIVIGIILLILFFVRERETTGGSCSSSSDCRDNLVCQNASCRVPTGGLCFNNNECLSGDGCVDGRCRTTIDAGLGQPCNMTDKPCKTGLTCESSVCKANLGTACSVAKDCVSDATGCTGGICVTATAGAFTGPCRVTSPGSTVPACNTGLTCSSSNQCLIPPGAGCEVNEDCANGFCSNNVCAVTIGGAIPDLPTANM